MNAISTFIVTQEYCSGRSLRFRFFRVICTKHSAARTNFSKSHWDKGRKNIIFMSALEPNLELEKRMYTKELPPYENSEQFTFNLANLEKDPTYSFAVHQTGEMFEALSKIAGVTLYPVIVARAHGSISENVFTSLYLTDRKDLKDKVAMETDLNLPLNNTVIIEGVERDAVLSEMYNKYLYDLDEELLHVRT